MSKAIRTTLAVSLAMCSALAMAQAGSNNADKNKIQEHRQLAKTSFSRHRNASDKKPKQAQPKQAVPKPATQKAEMKPASARQPTASKDQRQAVHANNAKKPVARKTSVVKTPASSKTAGVSKAPAASKTKPQQKSQESKKV